MVSIETTFVSSRNTALAAGDAVGGRRVAGVVGERRVVGGQRGDLAGGYSRGVRVLPERRGTYAGTGTCQGEKGEPTVAGKCGRDHCGDVRKQESKRGNRDHIIRIGL